MESISVSINGRHIAISGMGDLVQSDDRDDFGKITKRRVMKKICLGERVIQILQTEHSIMLRVIDPGMGYDWLEVAEVIEPIPTEKLDHWLVLEYDVIEDKFKRYYSPERI